MVWVSQPSRSQHLQLERDIRGDWKARSVLIMIRTLEPSGEVSLGPRNLKRCAAGGL